MMYRFWKWSLWESSCSCCIRSIPTHKRMTACMTACMRYGHVYAEMSNQAAILRYFCSHHACTVAVVVAAVAAAAVADAAAAGANCWRVSCRWVAASHDVTMASHRLSDDEGVTSTSNRVWLNGDRLPCYLTLASQTAWWSKFNTNSWAALGFPAISSATDCPYAVTIQTATLIAKPSHWPSPTRRLHSYR